MAALPLSLWASNPINETHFVGYSCFLYKQNTFLSKSMNVDCMLGIGRTLYTDINL